MTDEYCEITGCRLTEHTNEWAAAVAAAREATPGAWTEHDAGCHPHSFVCGPEEPVEYGQEAFLVAYVVGMRERQNRRFIAAANPATILATDARLKALAAENARLLKNAHAERDAAQAEARARYQDQLRAEAAMHAMMAERDRAFADGVERGLCEAADWHLSIAKRYDGSGDKPRCGVTCAAHEADAATILALIPTAHTGERGDAGDDVLTGCADDALPGSAEDWRAAIRARSDAGEGA